MAKIHKLTKGGQTIYPATTTDAVVNPNSRKSLTAEVSGLNENIEGLANLLKNVVEIPETFELYNYIINSNGNLTGSGGNRARYYNVSDYAGKVIRIKRNTLANNYQFVFYSVVRSDSNSFTTYHNSGSMVKVGPEFIEPSSLDIEIKVPDTARSLLVRSMKVSEEISNAPVNVTYTEGSTRFDEIDGKIKDVITEVEKLSEKFMSSDSIEELFISNNYKIEGDGNLITSPGSRIMIFSVEGLHGKTIRITREYKAGGVQWAFYNVIRNSGFEISKFFNAESLVLLGDNYTTSDILSASVVIPEGAKSIFITSAKVDDDTAPVSVTVSSPRFDEIDGKIKDMQESIQNGADMLDKTPYPTMEGWVRPVNINNVTYPNFRPVLNGERLVYGGANTIYAKKFVSLGDSLSGTWEKFLTVMSGMFFTMEYGYCSAGGTSVKPSPSQMKGGKWSSMQDRVLGLVSKNSDADIVFLENVNDKAFVTNTQKLGTIQDRPWMLSQYILIDNNYTTSGAASDAWNDNFSSFINENKFKKGSIATIRYSSTTYKLTLSGSPNPGNLTLSLNNQQVSVAVQEGDSLEQVATNIAEWAFDGYSATADGKTVSFVANEGTVPSPPVFNGGMTGILASISTTTSDGYVFRYFIGISKSDFIKIEKWSDTAPTLYACYKGMIEYLQTYKPTARLIWIQPSAIDLKYENPPSELTYEDGSWNINAWVEGSNMAPNYKLKAVQQEVCKLYRIECIDIDAECGITPFNIKSFYPNSNVHPVGFLNTSERWAKIIYKYMLS
jgi:hypothetical protein